MQSNLKQQQKNVFNDYTVGNQYPPYKMLSSHQRCMSSGSIYYQNNFSRKKLTVTSRDNSKPDLKGDYLMSQNTSGIFSSNRTKNQNLSYNNYININDSQTNQNLHIQHYQSLANSRSQKSKLKRTTSPSPMTPTKILKLKKSMLKQNNSGINALIYTQDRNLSRRKYESHNPSPVKFQIQSHRKLFQNGEILPFNCQDSLVSIQNLKKQINSLINIKILQFQSKISFQAQAIKILQKKLQENSQKLKDKQILIENLKNNRSKTTTFYESQGANHQEYIFKKVKDVQAKQKVYIQIQNSLNSKQQSIDKKIEFLKSLVFHFSKSKFEKLHANLQLFLKQKSQLLASLSQQISFIDNKLIGRTQVIRQTLAEIKQKVKEVQDSWTHKQTKDTTNRDKSYDDVSQSNFLSNKNIKHFQNKLKALTSVDKQKENAATNIKGQDSLNYSLTSYEQNQITNKNLIKNVYYDGNQFEMEDISINNAKDQSSRLTDDFYYPSTTNGSSKNTPASFSPINKSPISSSSIIKCQKKISPINKKNLNNVLRESKEKIENNFKKKQSPIVQSPIKNLKKGGGSQSPVLQEPSENIIKISNQAINKKIQCIKILIDEKKISSCQQIQKGRLRCFVDKSGYLKYIDSKTFVFDKKGNLISCTEGQFWFLVTKGLICGKNQDDESRTMSFIEFQ